VNSLTAGKIAGNAAKLQTISALFAGSGVHSRCNFSALRTIPCSARNSEFSLPDQGMIRRSREKQENRDCASDRFFARPVARKMS
jgi:hypothetical protein